MTLTVVRPAGPGDLPAIREIYNYFVRQSTITFDLEEVSLKNRRKWFEQFQTSSRYRLLAAFFDGELAGFAYSSRYRAKAAYDTSVETTIYIAPHLARQGIGRVLYNDLFHLLSEHNVHRAYAVITKPNEASEKFHSDFGFRQVGVLGDVGFKFGRFHSTGYWEKHIDGEIHGS